MQKRVAGLTTWFYVAALDGSLLPIEYEIGRHILEVGATALRPVVPVPWLDRNGGLTVVGIGLVLQMGRPAYVDRCSVSFHATPGTRQREVVAETVVDFEALAVRVLTDAKARVFNVKLLEAFLRASHHCLLLEDMFVLLQANRSDLEHVWLGHLRLGRQTHALFDLRTGELHAGGVALRLEDASRWKKGPRRNTLGRL